jgi:hypothetical protein
MKAFGWGWLTSARWLGLPHDCVLAGLGLDGGAAGRVLTT